MCGIVGSLSFSGFPMTQDYLNTMRDTLTHRGPDGAGTWISPDRRIGLGHRRLSILDLSTAAAQPMSDPSGRFWVTFNGEIYNHRALRAELIQLGVSDWKTDHSDTEVLLRAFQTWGIDCVHRFRGMFAFGLWDEREKVLWLVRDRIGVKPLYYSQHHGRLVFASEIKALLADPEQTRAVDEEALFYYLSFISTPAPLTLFDGIQKLEPGTYLRINAEGQQYKHRYWDVWDHTQPRTHHSEADIIEELISELRTAVQLRKESDVPVGVFLSGGIDSSTNAALFSENGTQAVKTFTIGYAGNYKTYRNELPYARLMADTVHAEHHELLLTIDDLLNFLPQMVYLQDEPIGDPVCVPVYYVSKLAKEHGVTVCQLGEGADELFWGYHTWRALYYLQAAANIPGTRWIKHGLRKGFEWAGKTHRLEYELLQRSLAQKPIFWGGCQAFSDHEKIALFSPRLQEKFKTFSSWDRLNPIWERYQEKAWEKSTLHWMSYLDLNYRLPELLLMRVDKMSMGVSVEGRVPFLDHKFVELAFSIPSHLKTRGGISKYLLKKAVRGIIPDTLIDRRKQGFGVPVYEWCFDRLGDTIREELQNFCQNTDYFNRDAINTLLTQKPSADIWYLLNLALWWKTFITNN